MRTILRSLVWKECREHVWKAMALSIVVCVLSSMVLLSEFNRESLSISYAWTLIAMVPLTMFIAANVSAGERSRNTANFLAALPVPSRQVAMVKLAVGLATIAIPIVAGYFPIFLWFSFWRSESWEVEAQKFVYYAEQNFPPTIRLGNWFISAPVSVFVASASIFAWAAAAGVNRRDEVSAAARAALFGFIGWATLIAATIYFSDWAESTRFNFRPLAATVIAALPCGTAVVINRVSLAEWADSLMPLIIGILFQLLLLWWFVHRYGREEKKWLGAAWQGLDAEDQLRWLGRPWPSPLGATAWKQARETGAIALVGVLGAAAVTVVFVISAYNDGTERLATTAVMAAQLFSGVLAGFSIFISLVAGVGVSFTDAPRGIDAFWRSRPINPSLWYWTKYVTGLLVLLLTMLVPVLLLALITRWAGSDDLSKAVRWEMRELGFIPANVAVYTAAMAATRMVQHAVYGAILGLGSLGIGPVVVVTGMFVYKLATGWTKSEPPFTQDQISTLMYAVMTAVSVAMLVAGWLAARNDWGWRKG